MTKTYLIGVDTGGTYTDAAIIEAEGHGVVASAKSITTKGDLAVGVTGAIRAATAKLPEGLKPSDISLVSVSTTLATNAVVEGHGSAVGVILIGFDKAMTERTGIAKAFPGMPIALIGGGHDHNGDEAKPLDTALIEKLMRTHEVVVTVEEGSIGGLGAHVLTLASDEGLLDAGLKIRTMRLPDIFQDHDDPMKQYDEAGLNAPQIVDTVLKALRHNSAGVEEARA